MADSHHDHGSNGHGGHSHGHEETHAKPHSFEVRVLRQDGPGEPSYWERHTVKYEPDMNVISVLQRIAAQATSAEGKHVAPVAWDCNCLEEVCGACTMVINGKVRQSCSCLMDDYAPGENDEITLEQIEALSRTLRMFRGVVQKG